jgi:hypothetical protein
MASLAPIGQSFMGSMLPGAMGKAAAPISWSSMGAPMTSGQLLAPIGSAASPATAATQMPLGAMGMASKAGGLVKDVAGQAILQQLQDASQPPQQMPVQVPQSPQLATAAPPPSWGAGRMPSGAGDHETMIRTLLARYS